MEHIVTSKGINSIVNIIKLFWWKSKKYVSPKLKQQNYHILKANKSCKEYF